MASTTAWLDDLSEDWESQPRNSSLFGSINHTNSLRKSSIDGRASQSRIPRPSTGTKKDKPAPRRRSSILSERSMSENNILKDSPDNVSNNKPSATRLSRSHSTSSLKSDAQYDTVDRKSLIRSPPKNSDAQLTPEWRKRLLKNNGDNPEQPDLFSPAGLERIFKNPKNDSAPSKQAGSRGISFLRGLETVPSSPPPLPSISSNPDHSYLDRHNQHSELEPVEEADEDEAGYDLSHNMDSSPKRPTDESEQSSEDTQRHNSLAESSLLFQPERAISQERPNTRTDGTTTGTSNKSTPMLSKDTDRTISGQSDLRHEGFSPVFLSKRDNPQGSVDYAASEHNHELSRHSIEHTSLEDKESRVRNRGDVVEGSSRLAESLPDDLETGTPEVAGIGHFVNVKRGGCSEVGSFKRRPLSLSFNANVSEISGRFSPISTNFSSPPSDMLPSGAHQPSRFRKASSIRLSSKLRRLRTSTPTDSLPSDLAQTPILLPKRRQSQHVENEESDISSVQSGARGGTFMDAKRSLSSPAKERTLKRQKTMHGAEFSELSKSALLAVQSRHDNMQSVIGKKRKDARHDSSAPQADPLILARRHILRPRNPTPSQRRGAQGDVDAEDTGSIDLSTAPPVSLVQEQLESLVVGASSPAPVSGPPLPEPIATMTMNAAKRMQEENRKRSYTTQDYLDEAMQIMSNLRAGRKLETGLGSVQESESEHHSEADPDFANDSTHVTISRPPSREGATSGWRRPVKQVVDAEVAVRLRKYQERENTDFTIDSSAGSLRLTTEHGPDQDRISVASKKPMDGACGGRAHDKLDHYEGNLEYVIDSPESYGSGTTKNQSAPQSWDSSTGRTVATSSTRRSETVANLAPNVVSHLIPEQIAGMSFDPEKHIWIKDKSLPRSMNGIGDMSNAEESEQDPLGNIPDLSVDEVKELSRNASQAGGISEILKRFTEEFCSPGRPNDSLEALNGRSERAPSSRETVVARPRTREGSEASGELNSTPARDPQLASSTAPVVETRATSWTTNQTVQQIKERTSARLPRSQSDGLQTEGNDVEHEIEVTHGRVSEDSRQRIRHVTISFSSPAIPREPNWSGLRMHTEKIRDHSSSDRRKKEGVSPVQQQKQQTLEPSVASTRQGARIVDRFQNLNGHINPFSQIQEHEEWSLLPTTDNPRELSFQVSVSPPQAKEVIHTDENALVPPSPLRRGDLTFYLSELPDFSVHQIDERRPSERVLAERLATHELAQVANPFAETTKKLVRELTNVEPEEPYWDELHELNLHDRHLTALCGLDEFCPQVNDLDVSTNGLRDLNGTPVTVRHMKAQNNSLSDLTSFAFLMNLQYLDVSQNRIDSLEGLAPLVHLRELRANDNEVSDLHGLQHLDGLQKVCLRRNRVETLDLRISHLDHLAELDLSGNQISRVYGLNQAPKLDTLVLDDNKLCTESFQFEDGSACQSLSVLKLRRNSIRRLPMALFPGLKVLFADENQIPVNADMSQLELLENLSLRRQQLEGFPGADNGLVRFADTDVRRFALSANRIPTFTFTRAMYDLQRLELASCGINSLPSSIGVLAPNLRFINLNSNAIKDLRPLVNVQQLRELHLAGNRLSRTRKVMVVLAKLRTLTKIDFRNNPFTVGFYHQGSAAATDLVLRSTVDSHADEDPHVLPQQSGKEDDEFRARLDEETHLRRRVYELLVASACKKLRTVDGLDFDRGEILAKDSAWRQLVNGGFVRKPESYKSGDDR